MALALLTVLSTLAWPSFHRQLLQSRRSDGIGAAHAVVMLQERWRSSHSRYSAELGASGLNHATTSPNGHYDLSVEAPEEWADQSHRVLARAVGRQAADTACAVLRIDVTPNGPVYLSGPNDEAGNDATANRQCWRR